MGMIGNSLAQGLISGANIQDGTVDTPDIKDSAVTAAKINDSAVTTAKINDAAVTTAKITDANVTTAKINDGAVTPAKLSTGHPNWDSNGRLLVNASNSSGSPVGMFQVWENTANSANVCIDARSGQAGGTSVGAYTTTLLQGSGGNSGSSGNVAIKMHHNDNLDLRGDMSFWAKDNQNTQYERMRIVGATGRIGMGTSDPQSSLHVSAGSAGSIYTGLTLQNTDNSQYGQGVQIAFKNSSYSGVEAKKFGYIAYRAESAWGEKGQFLIGLNNGYNVSPTNYVVINPNGDFYPNNNGGNLYARAGLAYANITDLGWTAPIQVRETDTGTTSGRYIPMISGTSVSANGYRQHTVFGSYRGSAWGSAIIAVGGSDNYPTVAFYFDQNGTFTAPGTKNFFIDHPLESMKETHNLAHAAIEGPQADLIYRGTVSLADGSAQVNLDTAARMTDGTFVLLTTNVQCFTSNETDWTPVKGSVVGNLLTITAQDGASSATVSWMVIAERNDDAIKRAYSGGRLIVEPLKEPTPDLDPEYELSPAPEQEQGPAE